MLLAVWFILDYFELAFRLWAQNLCFILAVSLLAVLSLSLLCITIKQYKKEKSERKILFVILGFICTSLFTFICVAYASIYVIILMAIPISEVGVISEGDKKYVVQHEAQDIGSGPYLDIKYDYVNFIVRGKQCYYPPGG